MKIRLPFLVLSVGQMCNLRCKDCANFAPYALPEMRKYSLESIVSDFESLFKAVAKIDVLQIQGGEPLVYKELPKLIGYLGECSEIEQITIATNGMLIPNDEVIHACINNKVKFRISNYPQNRNNLSAFVEKLSAYRIDAELYDFATKESFWLDCGGLDTPRENNDEVVARRFNSCSFKGCLTMENGELHRCSRAKNAYSLQGFNSVKGDFVNVRNNKNLYDDIIQYHTPPHFETACRYCLGTSSARKIPPAQQLKK